jgi:hypothetical protein
VLLTAADPAAALDDREQLSHRGLVVADQAARSKPHARDEQLRRLNQARYREVAAVLRDMAADIGVEPKRTRYAV